MRRGNPAHAGQRRNSVSVAQHVAARPLERPQIRLDQGQRKEGDARWRGKFATCCRARGKMRRELLQHKPASSAAILAAASPDSSS